MKEPLILHVDMDALKRRMISPKLGMSRRAPRWSWFGAVGLVAFLVWRTWSGGLAPSTDTEGLPLHPVRVVRVIDGDTVVLEGGERVRYLEVNTPELARNSRPAQFYAEEAKRANARLVEGKTVQLVYDREHRDKYHRILAYVYAGPVFVNAVLIEEGYGKVMIIPPNVRHAEKFLELQRKARQEGRGIWSRAPGKR